MRYQNFSIRLKQLTEAAERGGWSLEDLNRGSARPFWVATHPHAVGAPNRIAWSFMHGNEPTGFEALLAFMAQGAPRNNWTLVPLVNPTGIDRFTRLTVDGVDLNRCARITGPEESDHLKSVLQRAPFELALNLHDQRSIFHPRGQSIPSTLSVLAPRALIQGKEFVPQRAKEWAGLLSQAVAALEPDWGYARFDDQYYPEAFGEWTQELGIPTVTVETGVSLGDYGRTNIARHLARALTVLDHTRKPLEEHAAGYEALNANESTGIDLLLESPSCQSFWRVVEEVQPELGYRWGIARYSPETSGSVVAYQRIFMESDAHLSLNSQEFWTSSALYASASEGLRSFAAGLPR